MTVPIELDRRFRDTAASEGLLDVAYDLADSPVGALLVAATGRGLCRISFTPDEALDGLAEAFGARILRVPRQLDPVRRSWTSTSSTGAPSSTWRPTSRRCRSSSAAS